MTEIGLREALDAHDGPEVTARGFMRCRCGWTEEPGDDDAQWADHREQAIRAALAAAAPRWPAAAAVDVLRVVQPYLDAGYDLDYIRDALEEATRE